MRPTTPRIFPVLLFMLLAPTAASGLPAPAVTVDAPGALDALAEARTASRLRLDLVPGLSVPARVEGTFLRSDERFTVYGRTESEPPGSFLLTVRDGVLVGWIDTGIHGRYDVRMPSPGRVTVKRVELPGPGEEGCRVVVPDAVDTGPRDGMDPGPTLQDDGSVIDVMVVYTPAAKILAGGTTALMEATCDALIDQTNVAYTNSLITPRVRLVHTAETAYTESGTAGTDLSRVRGTADGHMDEIHAARNLYGADLVALLVSSMNDACGIAYLMNTTDFAAFAFSVTAMTCIGNMTFEHELGHNLGCCHARGDGGGCTGGGYFSYSVGHRFFGDGGLEYRTVMAYAPGLRIPYFSNPLVSFDGVPTGVMIGLPDEADNVTTINNTAFFAANWRPEVCDGILPSVTVSSPNGSETICAGQEVAITWSSSDEYYTFYSTDVSTDGGSTWSEIGAGATSGSSGMHAWTVADLPTTQARVRVTLTNCAGSASDTSDADFTIVSLPPVANLLAPVGGETVCTGGILPIEYADTSGSGCPATSYVAEYSADAGSSWTVLDSGDGPPPDPIRWVVPEVATSQARVRLTLDSPSGSSSAESGADFTIETGTAPVPQLIEPAGVDSLPLGVPVEVSWTNTGCNATLEWIHWSADGGASWNVAAVDSGIGTGSYSWTPGGAPTNQARVRIRLDNAHGTATDETADLVLYGAPATSVQFPAGGETWVEGTDHLVTWTPDPLATSHSIDWTTDSGGTWSPVVSGAPGDGGGSFVWTVPSAPGASARLRVTLTNAAGSGASQSGDFAVAAAAGFVDVSSLAIGGTWASRGVAWVDHDGDGDEDIVSTQYLVGTLLEENDGHADFVNVAASPLLNLAGDGYATAWADMDNDGDTDAYIVNNAGANRLVRNDGGTYVDVTTPPLDDGGNGRAAAWFDLENDGDVDLYLVNVGGPNKLFRNDGGTFVDATAPPLDDSGFANGISCVDADLDGDVDLYLASIGPNRLFRNDDGTFVDAATGALADAGLAYGASWGDMDNDGDPDVYIANVGANVLLRNDGGGVFADVSAPPVDDAGTSTGSAWADADLDGDLDLYVVTQDGPNRYFRNDAGTFVDATVAPLDDADPGEGAAWGDADGNGTPDLYVAKNGENKLLLNFSGGANRWLAVRLVGTVSNVSGVGARVRVETSGISQTREVQTATGYLSQSSLNASFGLGGAAVADVVEVTWPSGTVQTLFSIDADQLLTLVEGGTVDVEPTVPPAVFRLLPTFPNPFGAGTTIGFEIPREARVDLRIYDVSGRLVRSLVGRPMGPGRHAARWDGRDDSGSAVASGIYFYRLDAADYRETRRMVRIR